MACIAFQGMVNLLAKNDEESLIKAESIRQIFSINDYLDNKGPHFTLVHRSVTGLLSHIRLEDILQANDHEVNTKDDEGTPPLYFAAETGNAERVRLLIQHGADVNAINIFNQHALFPASWFGQTECVSLLLDAGADPNIANQHGETALYLATQAGYIDCVRRLLEGGSRVSAPARRPFLTALHAAVFFGYVKVVQVLIEFDADLEAKDESGRTPLQSALFWGYGQGGQKLDEVTKTLRKLGAEMGRLEGFECQNHGAKECYCGELIEELSKLMVE